ncbi:uncharacterized protein YwqG [Rhodoblastus acidophilus]|uniref:DUF1963 domain-containing protein n=1 Tax=Rhodoblastus acidophilus TaxID=1074 RepID=UPI0022256EC9|nr:DUF1963 domain-containing protein [Rhodoblastus acidophilus]MCW2318553.1 uncharacterized protein YwqG [Rhodoblastus acidophilus]
MNFWTSWMKPKVSDNLASVILKRQIPIRFDEAPRSWLGGLPMMPKGTEWPRDREGAPLHFVAQIACADLPAALWNGQGPRKGWLLLFVEILKFQQAEAEGGIVQVLHTTEIGVEHEAPHDLPTVRHVMSDYIGWASPEVRPGVPKLWRKWPVDVVVTENPFVYSAEELYQAPMSEHSISVHGGIDLDRPLTWRGALYVVEGVADFFNADNVERNIDNAGVLFEPPEFDLQGFNEEFERRAAGIKAFQDREVGWGPRVEAARAALTRELANERRAGWIERGVESLDKRRAQLLEHRDKFRKMLDEGGHDAEHTEYLKALVADDASSLERLAEARARWADVHRAYSDPEGEARLSAEIKSLGEAHLALIPGLRTLLTRLMNSILAQDLDSPLPEAEWRAMQASMEDIKSTCWVAAEGVPEKAERQVVRWYKRLDMAVREDVLDIYARGQRHPALAGAFLEDIEKKLRHMDRPHRVGGVPASGECDDPLNKTLLFEMASDAAMGWSWHGAGTLFVTISPSALRRNRFNKIEAWIEH